MYDAMKKLFFCLIVSVFSVGSYGQTIQVKIAKAYKVFESDPQLKNALSSLYIIDASTGRPVFDKNSTIGMAPASTQKIITAATAYELLGKDFRYTTRFGYTGNINSDSLKGSLYVRGSGDPTLGSWRWPNHNEDAVIGRLGSAIKNLGLRKYDSFIIDANGWESEVIPDGWTWQDIGNYYGAGAGVLNWRENQYDLVLQSGKDIGDKITVLETRPKLYSYHFISKATAAASGTGDNAYIYFPLHSSGAVVRGTIPVNEKKFVISGSMPSSKDQFILTLIDTLTQRGINSRSQKLATIDRFSEKFNHEQLTIFHEERSPVLDSMVYWFLRKSINLYGEALVKTFATEKKLVATTKNGIEQVRDFWKSKGIPVTMLNMADGSGLSPLNRVTTHAQVSVLKYARNKPWFNGFYEGIPEFNGMKMKSGTINGVKGYCGYHQSKDGKTYIFSFLVNNYNGSSSELVQKMYKVLDVLK